MGNSEKLRNDLKDYFGTAMFCGNPMAVMDLSRVESASEEELKEIAEKNGFDPYRY